MDFSVGEGEGGMFRENIIEALIFFFDISIAMNIQLSKYISNSLTALHIHSHCPSPNLVHY